MSDIRTLEELDGAEARLVLLDLPPMDVDRVSLLSQSPRLASQVPSTSRAVVDNTMTRHQPLPLPSPLVLPQRSTTSGAASRLVSNDALTPVASRCRKPQGLIPTPKPTRRLNVRFSTVDGSSQAYKGDIICI